MRHVFKESGNFPVLHMFVYEAMNLELIHMQQHIPQISNEQKVQYQVDAILFQKGFHGYCLRVVSFGLSAACMGGVTLMTVLKGLSLAAISQEVTMVCLVTFIMHSVGCT